MEFTSLLVGLTRRRFFRCGIVHIVCQRQTRGDPPAGSRWSRRLPVRFGCCQTSVHAEVQTRLLCTRNAVRNLRSKLSTMNQSRCIN